MSTTPAAVEPDLDPAATPAPNRRGWVAVGLVAALVLAGVGISLSRGSREAAKAPSRTASPTLTGIAPDQKLSWAPPVLVNPTTIKVTANTHKLRLDPISDYRLVLPPTQITLKGGLIIQGGHNVVMIGGQINVPSSSTTPTPVDRRGLYLKDQTGTLHIEGVRLSGDLAEGIDLDEPLGATVQLENIVVDQVTGSYTDNHADVLQGWAGPNILRVDGLQGSTTYQGFFLLPNQHFAGPPPQLFDLRRIVINTTPEAAYLLWTDKRPAWLKARDIELIAPGRDDLTQILRPVSAWESAISLNSDDPIAVLPAGQPGIGYVTPGYSAHAAAAGTSP